MDAFVVAFRIPNLVELFAKGDERRSSNLRKHHAGKETSVGTWQQRLNALLVVTECWWWSVSPRARL
jgi:hypothetical protein